MVKDMIGFRSGMLIVVSRAENSEKGTARWVCKCDCGEERINYGSTLRSGAVKSCGCNSAFLHTKHSMCFTPEYKSWQGMKERCTNSKCKDFHKYGGRGISVCDRWLNSFTNFYEDMGPRLKGQSIDRIDNSGNYEPTNCRWADARTQSTNRRSTNFHTINGITDSIEGWGRRIGITGAAFKKRTEKSNDPAYLLSSKMDRQGNVI